jgi:mono/diheme cytochrome c family protein
MKIPVLARAFGIVIGAYLFFWLFFTYGLDHLIPASVMKMYMFFVVVGVLMYYTFHETHAQELLRPLQAMVENPKYRPVRNGVFLVLPLLAFYVTYSSLKPNFEAPVELRTVHPAPPSSIRAFKKSFNLITLENPYRKLEKEDPARFKELVKEGGAIYYQNCFFCHGDTMHGNGPYSAGFNNPLPANFQDVGTIAQLQESFLFWRIATGGPGLPNEGTPWLSPMPIWQDFLTEDEIWKVILFLYDYTGHHPRTFEGLVKH